MNVLSLRCVDLPVRGRIRARSGISRRIPLALSLGRISRKKGPLDLIGAASGLSYVHVLILGPDSRDDTFEELIRASRNMNGRVHVATGDLWGTERLSAFADADCYVLA